jgi:hypothetical protein
MVAVKNFFPNQQSDLTDFNIFIRATDTELNYDLRACQTKSNQFVFGLTDIGQNGKMVRETSDNLEKLSPIFIAFNERKMIFVDNVFTDNIGVNGGAINIESPNMSKLSYSDPPTDEEQALRAYIFMEHNEFERNLAYLMGGAVYIRSTRTMDSDGTLCGLTEMRNNNFITNMGMNWKSSGGAVAISCHMMYETWPYLSQITPVPNSNAAIKLSYVSESHRDSSFYLQREYTHVYKNQFLRNMVG